MMKAARLINEQKATVIVEHLAYNPVEAGYTLDIFTREKLKEDFSKAVKTDRHIYDYVFTDSGNEREFVRNWIREPRSRSTLSFHGRSSFPPRWATTTPIGR